MTSVHPIADDTVVQISEDGLRSSDQQVAYQPPAESHRDQADHAQVADQEPAGARHSKSDELSDASSGERSFESDHSNRLERAASNQTDADATVELETETAGNVANRTVSPGANDSGRAESGDRSASDKDQANRPASNSSRSSQDSSLSSSSSSTEPEQAEEPPATANKPKENGLSLLDKGQTIFKPLINGLTNSLQQTAAVLFKSGQSEPEPEKFTFTWSNLSYFVHTSNRLGLRRKKRFIFNQINGELKSNQLFGLLGPSGAAVQLTPLTLSIASQQRA